MQMQGEILISRARLLTWQRASFNRAVDACQGFLILLDIHRGSDWGIEILS
jgi:hypothetical protein